jgi:hypothetical protein
VSHSGVELAAAAAHPDQPGRALTTIVALRKLLDELEELQVARARELGWSWSEVARPLGVSRQAVHRKYAERLAAADGERGQ